MTTVRITCRLVALVAAALFLTSCGGNEAVDNDVAFRFIQASPDSPMVNFRVDQVALRSGIPYKGGTGFTIVTPRTYDFSVEALLAGANQTIVDASRTVLDGGREYTLIMIGKDETDTVQSLIFSNATESIPAGQVRLQLVHAAPDQPALNIYLTKSGELLEAETPIGQVSYGNTPAPWRLEQEGSYVISVTPAGEPTHVLFQSPEIPLHSRDDLLLVVVANTATGSSPISLVVDNRFATRQDNMLPELLDKGTLSDLRVINLSPDAPAIDLIGDPATKDAVNVSFASGLGYLGNTGYVSAPPDAYEFRGVLSTNTAADPPPFSFNRTLVVGQRLTVLATGLLATIDDNVLTDDIRPIHAQGKMRFVHAAPGGGIVDVYVLAKGTDIAGVANPSLRNMGLRSATGHLGFTPGTYTVTFTEAGTKTPVVLPATDVVAGPGSVHTVFLRDAVRVDATSTGKPAGVLVVDDLAD